MPRKPGLGQGLDALVSSRLSGAPFTQSTAAAQRGPRWEYALLAVCPGKRRTRLWLTLSYAETGVTPKRRRIRGVALWTAFGILGGDGWELVAARRTRYVFKRQIAGAERPASSVYSAEASTTGP